MKFQIIEIIEEKNKDKYLIFFKSEKIKTYGYVWEEQLNYLKENIEMVSENIEERVNLYSKMNVIRENIYFNTCWVNLIKEKRENCVREFKKNPLLNYILDDKPSVVLKKKTKVSHELVHTFRSFEFKNKNPYSILNKLIDFKKIDEVVIFLYGQVEDKELFSKLKKNLLENFVKKEKKSLDINFEYLRTILFLREGFSIKFIKEVFYTDKYSKLLKSKLYEDFLYSLVSSGNPNFNHVKQAVIKFCFNKDGVKTEEDAFKELLRFNVPSNHLLHFSEMMQAPYNRFKPKIKDDALYFMNSMSRSWGRLKNKNFEIPFVKEEEFSWLSKIDGQKKNGLSIKVPKKYHDLVSWGENLKNCLGNSNAEDTYSGLGLIGVFKEKELKWVLSVEYNTEINQFEGYKGSQPSSEDKTLVLNWLSELSGNKIKMRKELVF